MASAEDVLFRGETPVRVSASNCHTVHVNVQFIIETRVHDSLRRWAELIEIERARLRDGGYGQDD